MDTHVVLRDGTIIEIDPDYEKHWKKYNKFRLEIAVLLSMFPCLVPAFQETMYSHFSDIESFRHYVTVSFAMVMVSERFGSVPAEFMDAWYPFFGVETFQVWRQDDDLSPFPFGSDDEVHQLTVTTEAVRQFMDLIQGVKTCIPSDTLSTSAVLPEKLEVTDESMIIVAEDYDYGYVFRHPPCEDDVNCKACTLYKTPPTEPVRFPPWMLTPRCKRLEYRSPCHVTLFTNLIYRDAIHTCGSSFSVWRNACFSEKQNLCSVRLRPPRISRALLRKLA